MASRNLKRRWELGGEEEEKTRLKMMKRKGKRMKRMKRG
jgi:hypothetical protein